MNFEIYSRLCKELVKNEYQIIKGCYDNHKITKDSIFIGFIKRNGGLLTIVYLIRVDNLKNKTLDLVNQLEKSTKLLANDLESRNISAVYLFIGGQNDISDEIKNLCNVNDIIFGEDVINLKWIVNTDTKQLIVLGNQPNKLSGLEKIIKNCFVGDALKEKNLNDIIIENREREKAELKTNNYGITFLLIAINIIVFIMMELSGGSMKTENLISFGAIVPSKILNDGEYYRLFTAMFIHIGYFHLFSNMFSLWIMGSRVEKYFGKISYLFIYLFSGLVGSLFSVTVSKNISAGASGAIFGLYGAILIYTLIKKKSMAGIDLYVILMLAIVSFGYGFMATNIDNFAHLGGFIGGIIAALICLIIDNTINKINSGEKKKATSFQSEFYRERQ